MKFVLSNPKLVFFYLAMLALSIASASASPSPQVPSCTTGSIQCCNIVEKASSPDASVILASLGISIRNMDVLVGLACMPINVIGVGGAVCSANVVCCEDNSLGGLVSIGCTPVVL